MSGLNTLQVRRRVSCFGGAVTTSTLTMLMLIMFSLSSMIHLSYGQRFDCSPPSNCVDRSSFRLKAIVHGTKNDRFWQEMAAAMRQAAVDMNVQLDLELYDVFDTMRMADDIRNVGIGADGIRYDALIVSIPDSTVQLAVGEITNNPSIALPIFGVNSGSDVANTIGTLGYVAMDENLAGRQAGDYFKLLLQRATIGDGTSDGGGGGGDSVVAAQQAEGTDTILSGKGLFVNHEVGNLALEERKLGLTDAMGDTDYEIERLDFFAEDDVSFIAADIEDMLDGCPYDFILLASGTKLAGPTITAMESAGCSFEDTFIGMFDTSDEIYRGIRDGKFAFTLSQQTHLQGSLPVVMAALYATTGKKLAPAQLAQFGIYSSGPYFINELNLPAEDLQSCIEEGFPICDNGVPSTVPRLASTSSSSTACQCTDRKKVVIAGVTHGHTADLFWDLPYAAMAQAGEDFNVDLRLVRFEADAAGFSSDDIQGRMVDEILKFCRSGEIDGIFVSIPSDLVLDAIRECLSLGIGLVTMNSGASFAIEYGFNEHIGQIEFSAGKGAGQRMIDAGAKYLYCLMHEDNNVALFERCSGVEEAVKESSVSGVQYMGALVTLLNSLDEYMAVIEDAVANDFPSDDGNWDGIGLVSGGSAQMPFILPLQEKHPAAKIGSFDLSDEMFDAMDDGRVLFGVDQNAYLQGYFPVALLTWNAYSKQQLADVFIESGPAFVTSRPSEAQAVCEAIFYEACDETQSTVGSTANESGESSSASKNMAFVGVVVNTFLFLGTYLANVL